MREGIGLYRGKRKDNGEWAYGGFHSRFGRAFIIGISKALRIGGIEVIPETAGEYTGLPDKNGKRIFEGDILKTARGVGYVVYGKGCFCVQYEGKSKPAIDIVMHNADVFVIGNIHDNPELLQNT